MDQTLTQTHSFLLDPSAIIMSSRYNQSVDIVSDYWTIEIWLGTSNLSSRRQADFKLPSLIPLMTQTLSLWRYGNKQRLFSLLPAGAECVTRRKCEEILAIIRSNSRHPRKLMLSFGSASSLCSKLPDELTLRDRIIGWDTNRRVLVTVLSDAAGGLSRHGNMWQKTLRRRGRRRTLFVLFLALRWRHRSRKMSFLDAKTRFYCTDKKAIVRNKTGCSFWKWIEAADAHHHNKKKKDAYVEGLINKNKLSNRIHAWIS